MTPRGIRNHNPGNVLKSADKWQGMAALQTDEEMVQFVAPEWGLRAVIRIVLSYQRRGLVTLRQVISTYCPPTHRLPSGKVVPNHTESYIAGVSKRTGVAPESRLDMTDREVVRAFLTAVVNQENGVQPYGAAVFDRAMDLAGVP